VNYLQNNINEKPNYSLEIIIVPLSEVMIDAADGPLIMIDALPMIPAFCTDGPLIMIDAVPVTPGFVVVDTNTYPPTERKVVKWNCPLPVLL
jgi:hypothetical protein